MQRLRWLSHVARKVFESEPGSGSRRIGRPRQRWAKQLTENATTLGIRNWSQAAIARDVWRRKLACNDQIISNSAIGLFCTAR